MPDLSLPLELLDLPSEGELVTRVTRWEEGTATIKPVNAPEGKAITVIRLHVPSADKHTAPSYWDVTATTLHPSLRANLDDAVRQQRWIRIQKFGVAPRARFAFEMFPVGVQKTPFAGRRS